MDTRNTGSNKDSRGVGNISTKEAGKPVEPELGKPAVAGAALGNSPGPRRSGMPVAHDLFRWSLGP